MARSKAKKIVKKISKKIVAKKPRAKKGSDEFTEEKLTALVEKGRGRGSLSAHRG